MSAMVIALNFQHMPIYVVYLYANLSIVTFLMYALDKSKAKKGAWRIAESTLHLFSLAGGWPGAAIAQQTLRHKSVKREFRFMFWLTVIVNCCALAWLISPYSAQMMAAFS